MSSIHVLPQKVANQIAAGEVVERPASVAKELLENALDAGASRIEVAFKGGGADLIRVADDGSGMDRRDAVLALQRHATSKISCAEDLTGIASFGFRGEALPSIASVSRMTLTTSTGAPEGGTRVRLRGGTVLGVEPASHPRGTTVEVEGLFANAPARRKFLRSRATEAAHIADIVGRIATAHPAISFTVESGQRELACWTAVDSYEERIAQIVGRERAAELIPVDRRDGNSRVVGLASKPSSHRSTARDETLFVNGRPIRDRRLLHAVHHAYSTLIPKGRYPIVYLFLQIPAPEVDINVHPAKAEVRFTRAAAVHDLVLHALLDAHGMTRSFYPITRPSFGVAEPRLEAGPTLVIGTAVASPTGAPNGRNEGEPAISPPSTRGPISCDGVEEQSEGREGAPLHAAGITPLAQYLDTYILASSSEGLIIIDQHAAHERVLYERLLEQSRCGRVERQGLLFPLTVEVSASQREAFEETADILSELGFTLHPFGPNTIRVEEVPALIPPSASERLVREILDEVLEWDRAEGGERLRARMAATSACHAAVRANHRLEAPQMRRIVEDLMLSAQPMTCPHGRPALLKLSRERLEKEFHRR